MPAPNTSVSPVPPKSHPRKQLMAYLTIDEHQRLKDYASTVDRTMSDIVREAIGQYIYPPGIQQQN